MSTTFLKAIWQWVSKTSKMHVPFDSAIPPFQETIQDTHRDRRLFITMLVTGKKKMAIIWRNKVFSKLQCIAFHRMVLNSTFKRNYVQGWVGNDHTGC